MSYLSPERRELGMEKDLTLDWKESSPAVQKGGSCPAGWKGGSGLTG